MSHLAAKSTKGENLETQVEKKKNTGDLHVAEEVEQGHVRLQDFVNLLSYSIGNFGFVLFFLIAISAALCQLYTTYWVSVWTTQDFEEQQLSIYPKVFGILILIYIVLTFSRNFVILIIMTTSTTNMHKRMVEALIRARILFFDSNPIGRIYTRFSKDITVLDLILPGTSSLATFSVFRTLTVAITVTTVEPLMMIVVLLVLFLMRIIVTKALASQRQCLRMDSIYRGPIHSTMAMIVNGLSTLRTYDRVAFFKAGFVNQLEKSVNVTFSYFALNRWMGMHLDMVCCCFSLCAASFAVFSKGNVNSAILAFTIQILTDVITFFSFSMRMLAELENFFTSSQRIY